tara:strand:+ start:53 stop:256 length:204 start_codon:yes stop_codon:yes gene_type:complete
MVISLDNIDNGKHILNVDKKVLVENEDTNDGKALVVFKENKDEELSNIKKEWEYKTVEIIPFYVFKD